MVLPRKVPEQLMQAGVEIHLLGGQQGKTLGEVHLIERAKIRQRVDARARGLADPLFKHEPDQIEILFHP